MAKLKQDVAEQLAAMAKMSAAELRCLWRDTFGEAHPGWIQKDALLRALGYHVQAMALGGLAPAVRKRLFAYADELKTRATLSPSERIKPGTRLVREWRGETHVVTAEERRFEYRGHHFQSLSEIARAITGTRWSGPAFFGLKADRKTKQPHDAGT